MVIRRPSPQTLAVLDQLAQRRVDWTHGYDLCRTLGLKAGTVYPILIRLAERDLLETAWEQDAPPGRPPRHLYRLSASGRAYAAESLGHKDTRGARRSTAPNPTVMSARA